MVLLVPAGASLAQELQVPHFDLEFRNPTVPARGAGDGFLRGGALGVRPPRLDPDGVSFPQSGFLTINAARFYGLEKRELGTLASSVKGAERAASLGLFLGAIGNTLGLWDERSSWMMVGAMAAAGAAYGAKKSDDPGWSIEYRWTDDD